jgi:hypothetical protein
MDETNIKTPLTADEKTERNKQRYLKLIERCRNQEYLTMEERKTKGPTPEEKKAAVAARRKITNQNYNNRHREAVNAYANNFMKEKYRTDEAYRLREIERGKLKYRRVVEQRRLDALAKEAATATTEKSND